MVNSIKCIFKVYKDTTRKTAFAVNLRNFIFYINESVVAGYFSTKIILFFKQDGVLFHENYKASYKLKFRLAYLV